MGKLNEKSEIKHTVIMFLLLCPLAYCFMHFGYTVVYPEFNYIASTLFPYILPIGMGLWFGYDTDRLYRLLDAAGPWLGIGFVLAGALSIVQGVFRLFVIDSTFMIFIRMLYTLFTALFALQLFRRVKSGGRFAKTLTLIGKYSFGIYLSHPLFLNILRNHLHIDKIFNTEIYMFNFTMSVILPMVFAFICSFALSILIRKLKTERFLG